MDLDLRGKRVLVTGSSSGIGEGIARMFAQEGARVFVHGRDASRTQAVADELSRGGAEVASTTGDLSTDAGADAVAAAVTAAFGGLDILVNNAGGKALDGNPAWFETPVDAWMQTFDQNIGAIVRLCHRFVPGMKAQRWGRIINIGSASGMQPTPTIPDYAASKAAINNLSVSLSKDLSATGITVNVISPGTILTPSLESWIRDLARQMNWGDDWATIEDRYTSEFLPLPIKRIGRTEDIGAMTLLLASERGSYITGANLRIDGGVSHGIA